MPPRSRSLLLTAPLAAAAIALSGLAGVPASAASTGLVISEVYGGGGNGGATYKNDFVELYNPTDAAIPVDSYSVQYRSATGTVSPTGVTVLSGSVAPHAHYLVQEAAGTTGGATLPTPDATGNVALSGTAATIFLASQTTALSSPKVGSNTGGAGIVDLVGYGSTNTFETAHTSTPDSTTSLSRSADGVDTDNNSVDLTTGAPSPESSDSTGGGGGGTGGDPTPLTIAQIQGTTDTSPYVGDTVVTDGVVTASYPTGGLNGFYVQTGGTGGDEPESHTSSDAVFAYLGTTTNVYPQIGDHVRVTGKVSEFFGLTEINPPSGGVMKLDAPAEAPRPVTNAYPGTAAGREALEGMLFAPGDFTVTDVFTLNQYAEIKLAAGDTPLRQPTDVATPGSPAYQAVVADNAARAVTLDDASTLNFRFGAQNTPLPWITKDHSIRVGAPADFTKPVVLDYRNSAWTFEPTSQLTADNGDEVAPAQFADTRTAAPAPVAGDLKIASFNVLNFFTETGADYVAAGHTCSSYKDRDGNPITVDDCGTDGPRGAWNDENQQRQQVKIVTAINSLGADVLSLEEIENSAKYADEVPPAGVEQRDIALNQLVEALNADAGSTVWAYVPSPDAADLPPLTNQDVIRTAFIYKVAKAQPVGDSHVLVGSAAFNNARQPLGQVFEPAGGSADQEFLAVVNHFKSKGSGSGQDADMGDGQGASNYSRTQQAMALVDFVDQLKSDSGVSRVFLTGDFNSYTQEDPLQVLYKEGYTDVGSAEAPTESTYVFDGLVGSLDHVLANGPALSTVQGAQVWNINSVESVAYEYSRFNNNATDFYAPGPYRSSDHDPTLVGFTIPRAEPGITTTTSARVAGSPRAGRNTRLKVVVTSAAGRVSDGPVEVYESGRLLATGSVRKGRVTINVKIATAGEHTLTVRYDGTDTYASSSTSVDVQVGP